MSVFSLHVCVPFSAHDEKTTLGQRDLGIYRIFRAPVPCVQPTRAEKQAATLKDPATEGFGIQWEDGVTGTAPTRLEPLLSLDIFICCFCFKSMSFSPPRLAASACTFVTEMKQGTDESQTRFQKPDQALKARPFRCADVPS